MRPGDTISLQRIATPSRPVAIGAIRMDLDIVAIDTLQKHVDKTRIFRHMRFPPERPYNDLPDLPPKAEIKARAILKACIEVRSALGELKLAGDLIANHGILINSIPLLEVQASSEIENIVTTADRLFQFANNPGDSADAATKEALRYRKALYEGFT
jgi:hypothetical protein